MGLAEALDSRGIKLVLRNATVLLNGTCVLEYIRAEPQPVGFSILSRLNV